MSKYPQTFGPLLMSLSNEVVYLLVFPPLIQDRSEWSRDNLHFSRSQSLVAVWNRSPSRDSSRHGSPLWTRTIQNLLLQSLLQHLVDLAAHRGRLPGFLTHRIGQQGRQGLASSRRLQWSPTSPRSLQWSPTSSRSLWWSPTSSRSLRWSPTSSRSQQWSPTSSRNLQWSPSLQQLVSSLLQHLVAVVALQEAGFEIQRQDVGGLVPQQLASSPRLVEMTRLLRLRVPFLLTQLTLESNFRFRFVTLQKLQEQTIVLLCEQSSLSI